MQLHQSIKKGEKALAEPKHKETIVTKKSWIEKSHLIQKTTSKNLKDN